MSKKWKGPLGPVTVVSRHRPAESHPSVKSALKLLGRHADTRIVEALPNPIALRLTDVRCSFWGFTGDPVVILDACGMVIPVWRVLEEWAAIVGERRHAASKVAPCPVVGSGRRGRGRGYRRMRTRREIMALSGIEADIGDTEFSPVPVKIRGKRKALPTFWDDVRIARRGRSWKAFRKTQYKV